jgi:hypothetical protein
VKINIYRVIHHNLRSIVVYDDYTDALNEMETHLIEGTPGDQISITIDLMEQEEYENLPEFQGF